jgi:GcrA cell cycle regulator
MSTGWDSNMLKKLKALVGKGLSTSEMGKKLGMSKNAVVGKLNRLGWNAKATETAPKKTAKAEPAKKTAAKKATQKVVAKKAVKKAAPVKPVKKVAEKKPAKSAKVVAKKTPAVKNAKTVAKSEKTVKKEKAVKEVNPVVKTTTASKKTKKDLALHELLIQHALQMANLKSNQCRWPIGDPDSDNFHFCGETVFAGKPYCYEHCRQAYQFTPPKKK